MNSASTFARSFLPNQPNCVSPLLVKELNLLSHIFIEPTGSAPPDQQAATDLTLAAQDNRKKVILAGLFVEREIEAIISFYLFPNANGGSRHTFLMSEILGSDAVSFSHKKRLIISLINQNSWLRGEAKAAFEKELAGLLKYRNAFTHGNFVVRDSAAFLEYFEGSKKKVELTDAYWADLEQSFNSLVRGIETVKLAAGMPQPKQEAF